MAPPFNLSHDVTLDVTVRCDFQDFQILKYEKGAQCWALNAFSKFKLLFAK